MLADARSALHTASCVARARRRRQLLMAVRWWKSWTAWHQSKLKERAADRAEREGWVLIQVIGLTVSIIQVLGGAEHNKCLVFISRM